MKKYILTTNDGDRWVYDDLDSARRAQYIFGGRIRSKIVEDEARTCPICGKKYTEHPALSRKDNETLICPQCGIDEALTEFIESQGGK